MYEIGTDDNLSRKEDQSKISLEKNKLLMSYSNRSASALRYKLAKNAEKVSTS